MESTHTDPPNTHTQQVYHFLQVCSVLFSEANDPHSSSSFVCPPFLLSHASLFERKASSSHPQSDGGSYAHPSFITNGLLLCARSLHILCYVYYVIDIYSGIFWRTRSSYTKFSLVAVQFPWIVIKEYLLLDWLMLFGSPFILEDTSLRADPKCGARECSLGSGCLARGHSWRKECDETGHLSLRQQSTALSTGVCQLSKRLSGWSSRTVRRLFKTDYWKSITLGVSLFCFVFLKHNLKVYT